MLSSKKNIYSLGLVIIGILIISISCDDNSRSLSNFGIDIATVVPEGENNYSLLLDNGKSLWPAASAVDYTPKDNQRVFLNYTVLSDDKDGFNNYIKVNDIWNILTKQVIDLNSHDENIIGNDPVKTNAIWIGGDYLNISFMFNYGDERPHAINLVRNNRNLYPNISDDSVDLNFRHNSYNSQKSRLYEGFVCFDLKPLRVNDADSIHISIKIKEWVDEPGNDIKETIYDVIYRYNQAATVNRSEMPIPVISSKEYY